MRCPNCYDTRFLRLKTTAYIPVTPMGSMLLGSTPGTVLYSEVKPTDELWCELCGYEFTAIQGASLKDYDHEMSKES